MDGFQNEGILRLANNTKVKNTQVKNTKYTNDLKKEKTHV
jgi:hypothetical protein